MSKNVFVFGFVLVSSVIAMPFNLVASNRSKNDDCLFKNPLCFYNADILSYQQTLYKTMQFDKMATFFYGSVVESRGKSKLISELSKVQFGYQLKRVVVKTIKLNSWSLMYQKTIMATSETFTIQCNLVKDTCRIWLDETTFGVLFSSR